MGRDTYSNVEVSGHGNRYFMPLIDLLASLVVILVLIVTASVLMQRPDFTVDEQTKLATERLRQLEERIRTLELTYVYPQDPANWLARQIASQLLEAAVRAGFSAGVQLHPREPAVVVPASAFFPQNDQLRLVGAERLLAVLGGALVKQAQCVPRVSEDCVDLAGGTLSRVLVLALPGRRAISHDGLSESELSALAHIQTTQVFAALLAAAPELAKLRGNGGNLVEAAGFAGPDVHATACADGCIVLHVAVTPRRLPPNVRADP